MKKKKSPSTSSNRGKEVKKNKRVEEIYPDLFTGFKKPVMATFFERLAEEFVNWAYTDKRAIRLNEFCHKKGICYSLFKRWCREKEPLKRVYEDVKLMLATRREKGMVFKEMDVKSNMHIMHKYDKDWQEANKYWSDLRKTEDKEVAETKTVIIDKLQRQNLNEK